jgi:hypothetical protein
MNKFIGIIVISAMIGMLIATEVRAQVDGEDYEQEAVNSDGSVQALIYFEIFENILKNPFFR